MFIIETTVMMTNNKKKQFFGVCDSKLWFLQKSEWCIATENSNAKHRQYSRKYRYNDPYND